jgi:bifunctional non-homologous end joining protein LigD
MPLSWNELTPKLDPASFTVLTAPQRLRRQKIDPWAGYFRTRQRLAKSAIAALDGLSLSR